MREMVALLDLGSNAVRFVLVRVTPGVGFRVLREERTQTRLGGGRSGTLPPAAIDDTLRAVRRFLRDVRNHSTSRDSEDERPPRIIAFATAAVRQAVNRDRLLVPLRRNEGIDVRVLSGAEEARLGATAALEDLPRFDGLVADLGGGSLQLTAVRGGRMVGTASMPLGTIRLTLDFLRKDPPQPRELRLLRSEIRDQLRSELPFGRRGDEVVGLGGTIRTLARIHLAEHRGRRRHRQGLRLQQADITAVRARLEAVSERERRHVRGLRAERADTILAGAILVEEVLTFGGYLRLVVSTRGVRDGLLLRETFGRAR
jgi:exopolyphosphatase / guanosine-5'-triphosphate,3'-diphosphate pyrophosphatase